MALDDDNWTREFRTCQYRRSTSAWWIIFLAVFIVVVSALYP